MAVLVSSKMKPYIYKRRHADVDKACSISLLHSILSNLWRIHSFLLHYRMQKGFSKKNLGPTLHSNEIQNNYYIYSSVAISGILFMKPCPTALLTIP